MKYAISQHELSSRHWYVYTVDDNNVPLSLLYTGDDKMRKALCSLITYKVSSQYSHYNMLRGLFYTYRINMDFYYKINRYDSLEELISNHIEVIGEHIILGENK